MRRDFSSAYTDLYREHWWFRAREEFILRVLVAARPPAGWESVLDVGCGQGYLFDKLAELGRSVEGVEPDAELVRGSVHAASIYVGPFGEYCSSERYDLILLLDVLEHLEQPDAALRQVRDLLDSGGRFVVTVPAFMALWSTHDEINAHVTRYTRSNCSELVQQAGLTIDRAQYFFHWVYFAKLLNSLHDRVFRREARVPRVPPARVNRLLLNLCRCEQELTRRIRPGFGSSLLVVGHRP